MTIRPIRRALISVSDKTDLLLLGHFLHKYHVAILSTGGTAHTLRDAGIPVTDVSGHTGFPEIMDGRVKTLHPTIHGGLLGIRDNPEHDAAMEEHGIAPIDLLVVNLYPFEAMAAKNAPFDDCIENIDIGGPALIRAAAKNHEWVTIVVDTSDYGTVMDEIRDSGGVSSPTRRRLAAIGYARTSAYDAAIGTWFSNEIGETFPRRTTFSATLKETLRYGENPHQKAALYIVNPARPGVASATQLQGKELSYNNLNDTDAAFELAAEFTNPAIAIIKHANPCGVAVASTLTEAYHTALACDPVSAFGGIIATNRSIDGKTAQAIIKLFAEVIIAPALDDDAKLILATKKNLRVLVTGSMPNAAQHGIILRNLAGGYLVQSRDYNVIGNDLTVVSKRQPTSGELADLRFSFTVCKHVKSNAIVYAKNGATVGIGAGQMSRVDSSRIAAWKAHEASQAENEPHSRTFGSVVASDAFFPFPDGLIAAAEAGATAVIQPGGSIRDEEVIAAADERNLAMVFTNIRHFRH
jgi:phosphoribosylaminoimidazolecarboxamide formyltransferase/IMP cyclohydrolase